MNYKVFNDILNIILGAVTVEKKHTNKETHELGHKI